MQTTVIEQQYNNFFKKEEDLGRGQCLTHQWWPLGDRVSGLVKAGEGKGWPSQLSLSSRPPMLPLGKTLPRRIRVFGELWKAFFPEGWERLQEPFPQPRGLLGFTSSHPQTLRARVCSQYLGSEEYFHKQDSPRN